MSPLPYCETDHRPSGIYRRIDMITLRERAQRLLEEAVFRLWVGAGIAVGAFIAARYLAQAVRSAPKD